MTGDEIKLRDRIAEEALHILTQEAVRVEWPGNILTFKLARQAYDIGDAFIRERQRRLENQGDKP